MRSGSSEWWEPGLFAPFVLVPWGAVSPIRIVSLPCPDAANPLKPASTSERYSGAEASTGELDEANWGARKFHTLGSFQIDQKRTAGSGSPGSAAALAVGPWRAAEPARGGTKVPS